MCSMLVLKHVLYVLSFPDRVICVNCTCKKRQDLMMIRGCEKAKYNLPPCETGCCLATGRLQEAPGSG